MIPNCSLPTAGSSSPPRMYRPNMLNSRCSGPACRKPEVIRRQYSPCSMWNRDSPPSSTSVPPALAAPPPPSRLPSATITFTAIST